MKRVSLLGVDFDDLSLEQVVALLLARPAADPFTFVVTPNVDHLARLRSDPELAALYRGAWLCLLDSRVLARLTGWLGLARPRVVTGADLTEALLARLDDSAAAVAVIGMAPAGFAELQGRYPRISLVHHAPPMDLARNPAALAAARDFAGGAGVAFVFIALGSPLQERLAAAIAATGATGIGLCIGAALEFCAGRRRAPAWMRQAGLEWLYRLWQDPRRLAVRYLWRDPPVLLALLLVAWRRRRA